MQKKLYRSTDDRMIWGVCGGLAKYFDVDPTIVRVIMVLLVFANGLGLLAYIILAIVTPVESSMALAAREPAAENTEGLRQSPGEPAYESRPTLTEQEGPPRAEATETTKEVRTAYYRRRIAIGVVLVLLGGFLIAGNLDLFWWFRWGTLWPLIIVAIGLLIVLAARR